MRKRLGQEQILGVVKRLLLTVEGAVRQAPAHGVSGVQSLAHQNNLHGALNADRSGQPLRASPGGQQSQVDFRQTDLSRALVNDQSVITSQGELEAPTQTGPVNYCHRLDRQLRQLVEESLACGGNGGGLGSGLNGRKLMQVGTG